MYHIDLQHVEQHVEMHHIDCAAYRNAAYRPCMESQYTQAPLNRQTAKYADRYALVYHAVVRTHAPYLENALECASKAFCTIDGKVPLSIGGSVWEVAAAKLYSQDSMQEANATDTFKPELECGWRAVSIPSTSYPASRGLHEHDEIARFVRVPALLAS